MNTKGTKGRRWASSSTTKADLVDRVAARTGMTKVSVTATVDAFLNEIAAALLVGDRVELRRWGVFSTVTRAPKVGKDFATGELVEIPASRRIKFVEGKQLRDIIAEEAA